MIEYPNRTHGIYEGPATATPLYNFLLTRFVTEHLPAGAQVPRPAADMHQTLLVAPAPLGMPRAGLARPSRISGVRRGIGRSFCARARSLSLQGTAICIRTSLPGEAV